MKESNLDQYKFLDIVLPSFEEHETVSMCVRRIIEVVGAQHSDFRIIVVIDGPDSKAVDSLNALQSESLVVVELERNYGKGYALMKGTTLSNSKYVAFLDADMDIHPRTINSGIKVLEAKSTLDATYGSKMHPDSNVNYPIIRRWMSWMFRVFTRYFINIDVNDTQTGVKVFRSSSLKKVSNQAFERGYLFDLEILMLMSDNGSEFEPLPIDLDFQFNSSIKPLSAFRMIVQLVALRRRVSQRDK